MAQSNCAIFVFNTKRTDVFLRVELVLDITFDIFALLSSMSHVVYILYSEQLDKFYVGRTSDALDDRIRRHLSQHDGFTGRAKNWKLVYSEACDEKSNAVRRETEIKSWKSKNRIKLLIENVG